MGARDIATMHPVGCGGMLVLLVGLATTASLQEFQEVGALNALAPDSDVLLSMEEGVRGIDVDVNKKGEASTKKLGYDKIPGFVLRHMGQEQTVGSLLDCEEVCDKHDSC